MAKQNLTVREKIGFGLGDTASNIVFQAVTNVLQYFYTETFGISTAAVGTLMLVVRVFDAITDPIMGGIADRTRSRHGRYRPWLLWIAIPYGLLAVAAFFTPDTTVGKKLVYAYVTYALLMTAYTAINVPYSALGGVMTGDSQERGNLQTWRFAMAMVGGFLVTAAIFPLAKLLGGGEDQASYRVGFPLAMSVMAVIAVISFYLCFRFTREHVYPDDAVPKRNLLQDVGAMFTNSQWLVIAILTLLFWTRGAMQGGAKPYFVDFYLVTENLPGWLSWAMGSKSSKLSAFLGLTMLAGVFGAIFANYLGKRWCKVSVMRLALSGTIILNALLMLVSREAVLVALMLMMVGNFFHMMFIPMLFSTIPDTVDYGIRTKGKGAMAMFCAGHLFMLKLGLGFGGFFLGHFLGWFGYEPGVEQSDQSLLGIRLAYAGTTVAGGVIALICLQFYHLKRGWEDRIVPAS